MQSVLAAGASNPQEGIGLCQWIHFISATGAFDYTLTVDGKQYTYSSGGLSGFVVQFPDASITKMTLADKSGAANTVSYLVGFGQYSPSPTVGNLVLNKSTSSVQIYSDPTTPLSITPTSGATVVNGGSATITTAVVHAVAAGSGARSLRFSCAGPGNLYIGGTGVTPATGILVPPGTTWTESDAPNADWYIVSDSTTNCSVQGVF